MIGVAFRQMRAAIIGTTAATGVLVVALVVHAGMAREVSSHLTQACRAAVDRTCRELQNQLWDMHITVAPYLGYLTITTVLVAVFWGAPLVSREVESGTAALAWTQSVTRQRWLLGRMVVSVATVGVLGLSLGFAVTWWLASFTASPQASDAVFSTSIALHGPLLPALWISALLVGVLVGTLITRTLPAMAVTAAVTFLIAIAVNLSALQPTVHDQPHVLANQIIEALVALIVGALAAALARRRIRHIPV